MHKGKVVFVVGHANWGKSKTLRSLTNGNYRLKKTRIGGVEFFIRRMSNDDRPKGYVEFMKSHDPANRPYLIAALCPQFNDLAALTAPVLTALRDKGCQLFFWVIEHQYGTHEVVTPNEIQRLRKFGKVEVFSATAESNARAMSFKRFVSNVALG